MDYRLKIFVGLLILFVGTCRERTESFLSQEKAAQGKVLKEYPREIEEHALVVVHGNTGYDYLQWTKSGIDSIVRLFKERRRPIFYLVGSTNSESPHIHYMAERNPTALIYSGSGENNLKVKSTEVTVIGMNYRECQGRAIRDLVEQHFSLTADGLTINLPMEAIGVGIPTQWDRLVKLTSEELKQMDKLPGDTCYALPLTRSLGLKSEDEFTTTFDIEKIYKFSPQKVGAKVFVDNRLIRGVEPESKFQVNLKFWTSGKFAKEEEDRQKRD